jgi:uncharacterized membrane protein YvbJ
MALVSCPDCGRQISRNAVACPNCGAPSSMYDNKSKETYIANPSIGKGKIVLGGILIFFGVVYSYGGSYSLGVFCIVLGLALSITGKFQNWWHWK